MAERSYDNQRSVDTIRRALANGFAFVRSSEVTEHVSSRSFEELLALAIEEIEQSQSNIRPSKIEAIEAMKQEVLSAVEQAKQMPSSVFELTDTENTTNTSE